jgi:hypothetical protein
MIHPLLNTLDNSKVAFDCFAKHTQGLLIVRAVMRGNRLCRAAELNEYHSLV